MTLLIVIIQFFHREFTIHFQNQIAFFIKFAITLLFMNFYSPAILNFFRFQCLMNLFILSNL